MKRLVSNLFQSNFIPKNLQILILWQLSDEMNQTKTCYLGFEEKKMTCQYLFYHVKVFLSHMAIIFS